MNWANAYFGFGSSWSPWGTTMSGSVRCVKERLAPMAHKIEVSFPLGMASIICRSERKIS